MSPESKKTLLWLGVFSLLVLLFYLLLWFFVDSEALTASLNELASRGRPIFFAATVLAAAVSLPRQVIALAAGMTFGWLEGLALASLAVLTGNAIQFATARLLLRPFLRRSFANKLAWMDNIAALAPFRIVLMLRLLPAGHSGLINLAAGASSIRATAFLSASYLGQLPQNAIFALAGSGLRVDPALRFSLAGTLFLVSLGLAAGLYKRYKTVLPGTISYNSGN